MLTKEDLDKLKDDPVAKASLAGVLLASDYRQIKDERPLLVKLDQPSTNSTAAGKLALTTVLTIGAVVAGNEITRYAHRKGG